MMARVGYLRDDDLNVEMVVIADESTGDTIEIQRAFTFDAQDVASGMDSHCVVRGEASHYGGIVRWAVDSNMLALELSEAAATVLALPNPLSIPIDDSGADLLRKHLPELCRT
jgi:hypothetical protein